ncbi:MAG TPA: DUF5060 domain-containing protein [Trueperaceae bacterium]
MSRRPRRSASALEYLYVAALVALALVGFLAGAPRLPDSSSWAGPFPVVAWEDGAKPPEVPVNSSLDIEVLSDAPRGDPNDPVSTARFTNEATGERYAVEAFYVGGRAGRSVYRFRFTPRAPGRWTFETTSSVPGLDGLSGAVTATGSDLEGPMTARDGRFAVATGAGEPQPTTYNVYGAGGRFLTGLGDVPRDVAGMRSALEPVLEEVRSAGFDALHVAVNNEWLALGRPRWDRHAAVQPDPATFQLLETLLVMAHERGLFVHFWMWGDEARRFTPLGLRSDPLIPGDPGGPTGAAFERVVRYIAARLGPIPNWTMSYGFDLHEWADEGPVRAWAARLSELLPMPHLLTATEEGREPRAFDLGASKLPIVSRDRDPYERDQAPFGLALQYVAEGGGRPLLFESRYLIQDGGPWDAAGLAEGMWGYAMAGGVGAIYDRPEGSQLPEDAVTVLRTFRDFWRGRVPSGTAWSSERETGELALVSEVGDSGVLFARDTDVVDLSAVPTGSPAVAVDVMAPYSEVAVDTQAPTWRAPHASDWAVAFGAAADRYAR